MSTLIPGQQERRELGSDLSKRQRMKLEKAMRRQDSLSNQQIKHPKRRAHSSLHNNEPSRRKEVKIDPHPSRSPHDQLYSSPINSSDPLSTTPPNPQQPPRTFPTHLNPRYTLPEGDGTIFNYLMHYTYTEEEKRLEKECQDWSVVDELGQAPLAVTNNLASVALCRKINSKIREVKDRLREPLGKAHRELSMKFLTKKLLLFTLIFPLHQFYLSFPAFYLKTIILEVNNVQLLLVYHVTSINSF